MALFLISLQKKRMTALESKQASKSRCMPDFCNFTKINIVKEFIKDQHKVVVLCSLDTYATECCNVATYYVKL